MPNLIIHFNNRQMNRFKAAFKEVHNMQTDPTDEQMEAALMREAAAITSIGEKIAADKAAAPPEPF